MSRNVPGMAGAGITLPCSTPLTGQFDVCNFHTVGAWAHTIPGHDPYRVDATPMVTHRSRRDIQLYRNDGNTTRKFGWEC